MNLLFRDPANQAAVDDSGVFRWKDTGLVVCDASLRRVGITDPDILRANEIARLNDFLKLHEDKT
jgi:hypothetical protein